MAPSWVKELAPSAPQGTDLLSEERAKSNFDIQKLSDALFTKEAIDRRDRILHVLQNDKAFDKSGNYYDGRVERYKTALARSKRLRNLTVKHGWTPEDYTTAQDLIGEPISYALHTSMYTPTIREQGTPEQHEKFLREAEDFRVIGCYAQTELGHGSNVRGLETTATWDPNDKTFVLHSPHLTASKWWIGTLGRTATHAIVMAQLIVDGQSQGPHPFVCQLRDLKTHQPLEGRFVGDIGPKLGYNTMDNGFLLFNKVKIPHVNMLARYARVDPQTNQYVKPPSASLVYGTLTFIRATIVRESGRALARGVTIAIRYCSIRRQFQDRDHPDESGEKQVIDYTMVQYRLFPLLATTFALHFTGKNMMALYLEARRAFESGSSDGSARLAELHATSCGLKALGTFTAAAGLEVSRRACGGHGYSSFAGIGAWYADYVPASTWEGDNYMLTQQVARYLLKSARSVLAGTKPTNITETNLLEFHSRSKANSTPSFNLTSNFDVVAAFACRAAFLTFRALRHRDNDKRSWNSLLVEFWRLSTAHSQYFVVKSFYDALSSTDTTSQIDAPTVNILWTLFRLYALHTIVEEANDFYQASALTTAQVEEISESLEMKLLEEVRPHAVSLVDAWGFSDFQLDSSLGRKDGRVYEDMFYRASELNPLNRVTADPWADSETILREEGVVEKSKL